MRVLIVIMALVMTWPVSAGKMMGLGETARVLSRGVVKLTIGAGHCTASKIGPQQFLTAGHCAQFSQGAGRIEYGYQYLFPGWAQVPKVKKSDGRRHEDWAIIHTTDDSDDIETLELGCGEILYEGQMIAYYGYSGDSESPTFGSGRIASTLPPKGRNDADFTIDVQAAPGSSGAPIVSIDSGKVIGILTEGVSGPRVGFYLIGVESVNSLPVCREFDDKRTEFPIT